MGTSCPVTHVFLESYDFYGLEYGHSYTLLLQLSLINSGPNNSVMSDGLGLLHSKVM